MVLSLALDCQMRRETIARSNRAQEALDNIRIGCDNATNSLHAGRVGSRPEQGDAMTGALAWTNRLRTDPTTY